MNYSINVSLNGSFFFEINRLSDLAENNLFKFVERLRSEYSVNEGYKITVSKVSKTSTTIDI